MKKNKEKVAAVVVTFNHKDLLQECLEALLVKYYIRER